MQTEQKSSKRMPIEFYYIQYIILLKQAVAIKSKVFVRLKTKTPILTIDKLFSDSFNWISLLK